MASFYQDLADARISDSNWEPSIYVDVPPPKYPSDIIPSCIDMKKIGKTNIVPLMAKPSVILEQVLANGLKYPKGASFFFEGFNGLDDKDRLVSHIIDSAQQVDGTQLVPGRLNKTPNQKT